ncbi:hypothetical protein SAMN05660710_00105 [Paracoccus tibetensis]|uniref:Uncharacterized protein n=2 Tax=Paracoccus tibetensis TaxID=336292 RepID=A0A1G5BE02_9RHOB|nr:hypothetical protein SAMN05660710_00105 [Paracoccus tibetensis]
MIKRIALLAASVALASPSSAHAPEGEAFGKAARFYGYLVAMCEDAMRDSHHYEWREHRDFLIEGIGALTRRPAIGYQQYTKYKRDMEYLGQAADDPRQCSIALDGAKVDFISSAADLAD